MKKVVDKRCAGCYYNQAVAKNATDMYLDKCNCQNPRFFQLRDSHLQICFANSESLLHQVLTPSAVNASGYLNLDK